MSKLKIRATILDISGQERYEIIKAAISKFNTAVEHNFYLEATALIESLISDRLESRLSELKQCNISFDTLGNLLNQLRILEDDPILTDIMNRHINNWSGERNKTIHQAVKIQLNEKKDWDEFLKLAKKTAIEGRKIFDAYNKQLQKIRRKKK